MSQAKVQVGPLVNLPCVPQPRPKRHWTAPTKTHVTSNEGGLEDDDHWCEKLKHTVRVRTSYGGGGGAQLVRCGPATIATAMPAPRPSLLSQLIVCSGGQWPCSCSKRFQVPTSLAGVEAEDFGFWALPPRHTTHLILSPGRDVYSVFDVWVFLLLRLCLLALAPLGHTPTPLALWCPRVMEGSRCERS